MWKLMLILICIYKFIKLYYFEGKNKMKAKHEAALNMIKLIVKETPAHKGT